MVNIMSGLNAKQVLVNVNNAIAELEANQTGWDFDRQRMTYVGYSGKKVFRIRALCNELSIFDWWNDNLSMSQLKSMKKFLEQAIKLGFTGYACFKVGAAGCANGMWASTEESHDGFSPRTGNTLYHSFVAGENYWDVEIDGQWLHDKSLDPHQNYRFTLAQVKEALA